MLAQRPPGPQDACARARSHGAEAQRALGFARMPALFSDDDTRKAFQGAVRSLEMRTGAEVLVAIRERSGIEPLAATRAAIASAALVLAVLVFSPWHFRAAWFFIDPVVFGLLGAGLTWRVSKFERLFTTQKERLAAVAQAAAHTFVKKGLHRTRDRTGLLVYLGVRERGAVVIADHGILAVVDRERWTAAVLAIIDAMAEEETSAREVAGRISELGHVMAAVSRRQDDVDEVPEEVVFL